MYLKLFLILVTSVAVLLLLLGVALVVGEDCERSEKGGDYERVQNRQNIT